MDKIVISDNIKLKDESVLKGTNENEQGRATFNSDPGSHEVFSKLVADTNTAEVIPGNHITVDMDQVRITIPMKGPGNCYKELVFSKKEMKQILQEILYT